MKSILLSAVLTGALAPLALADASLPTRTVLPGGLADAAAKVGFIQIPDGTIDAIELEKGKTLWHVAKFGRPLMLLGDRLVAQGKGKTANSVNILIIEAKKKKLDDGTTDYGVAVSTSKPIVFPEWVSVATTYGRSFSSDAALDDKGRLLLRWEARAFYAGGARPTPEIEAQARKHAAGIARVDLASGEVEMLKPEKTPPMKETKFGQYWTGSTWETQPLKVGKKLVALGREQTGKQEKLNLLFLDAESGKPEKTVALMTGKSLFPQLATDGKHLFVHQAIPKEQLPAGEYAWSIFDLETGKRLAKVPFEPGTRGLSYADGRVFTLLEEARIGLGKPGQVRRTLRAFDAKDGTRLWERQLWGPPVLPPLP